MSFLLNRLDKKDKDEILHSSLYGRAQNKDGFGTTSYSAFKDRLEVDRNRKTIRGYRDAQIVNEASINSHKSRVKEKPMQNANGVNGAKNTTPPAMKNPGIFR
ncbi:hypothetical protein IKG38_01695 [Candidatus Saccharibacteria bacterium]|nr:hypothetical protein [Candidatus Saccharibacteria bacterium]